MIENWAGLAFLLFLVILIGIGLSLKAPEPSPTDQTVQPAWDVETDWAIDEAIQLGNGEPQ